MVYRTFEALLAGTPPAKWALSLSEVAHALPVAGNVRTHLVRMGVADQLTLAQFARRGDLHRRLTSIIPLQALIRAVQEFVEQARPPAGDVASSSSPAKPKPPSDEELRARSDVVVAIERDTIRLVVDPLGTNASLPPGAGPQSVTHTEGGSRHFAHRRFDEELVAARALVAALGWPAPGPEFTWRTAEHLDRLFDLNRRADVAQRWSPSAPQIRERATRAGLHFAVTSAGRDWFDLDGHVEHAGGRTPLTAVFDALARGRPWFHAGDGTLVPLDDESRTLLDGLRRLRRADGAVPAAARPVLATHGVDSGVEGNVDPAPPPEGLHATLRPYQLEGFRWLVRMSQLTSGAVLADDMGLGKTVQATALLLHRAPRGPALVVAPSSVVSVWHEALERWAPSLSRAPDAVTVTSWAKLARDRDALASRHFATVVLDEAQSLKNADTQRARAAFGLSADFVVALSGTPVENHVRELWSLFRATVPAVFGDEASFVTRFSSGPEALEALAQVARPFILRRTKQAVLPELPPKTERTLRLELSATERAFIESLRVDAVTALRGERGEKRFSFSALAALTRLRLAACHPRLVEPNWAGPTTKLDETRALISALRESGHRVLVFSQFTKHLALVRAALEADGVTVSYLDGAVPSDERGHRVSEFQAGRGGDVFLISLKAGGSGLTLTAADDVIHLDPWWNPAVEDQASDRAHRLGQTKPVTVYRLISEGTVEEKMLALHAEKRALVDAVLEGADGGASLTPQEWWSLFD